MGKEYSGFEYIKSSGGIDGYRLKSNGLTVLLLEDHSAPVVTFMVTYHVGSRNEAVGYTGSTHLLEHLMFKGSRKYNKDRGTSIWTVLQNVGARINATTWMDRTNYYELLPSEHLEEAVKIEADRMRNAYIRDSDRQPEMTVVRNEFERGENDPFGALDKQIWATAYQAHPYHHATIGWRTDIENVSTERLKEFYNTFYWPNNATVTIIGDADWKKALTLVKNHFGRIRKSPHEIPKMYTEEPEQEGPRRIIVKRAGQNGIVGIAHKIPEGLHEDTYPIQILSNVLGGGKSSRLYKQLVDAGLATDLYMWDYPFHDNGLFITYVFLTPDTDPARVEEIVLEEYQNIRTNGVTEGEVQRAKAQITAQEAYSRDGSYSIAARLNEAIAIGDWSFYTTYGENISAVTAQAVQEMAQKYLLEDKSTTGHFIPNKVGGSDGTHTGSSGHNPYFVTSPDWEPGTTAETAGGGGGGSLESLIVDQSPLGGMRLLTMKTEVEDVVTLYGSFLGGDVFSPKDNTMVADITAVMLDQGTGKHNKFEISEKLESVGATLGFSSGQYRVGFNARCLKKDVPLVIELVAEQLREPAFSPEDLKTVKRRYVGRLKQAKESTRRQTSDKFLNLLYPEGHPNYRKNIDEEIALVEKLTSKDLKSYHSRNYGLGSLIVVAVGDVDSKLISEELIRQFKEWGTSPLETVTTSLKANAPEAGAHYVTMQDKTSTDMHLGQSIGIDRNHEDYYPLMVGVYILGGNFSARLMQTVRDEQGLTYGIGSSVQGVDYGNDGYWYVRGTFSPELLQKGWEATLEQVQAWVSKGVTNTELEAKKSTLTGSYKVGLANTRGLAAQILANAERGRPTSHLDNYPGLIMALTLDQVNKAIQTYVVPENLVFVSAGSVDSEGNLLKE